MREKIGSNATRPDAIEGVPHPIVGYHHDDEGHWVAQLACGYNRHVRHDPPMVHREWVKSSAGRDSMLGFHLGCKKCVEDTPADDRPASAAT